jgi:hypothetical protein
MEIFFSASSPDPMRVAPLTGWLILPFLIGYMFDKMNAKLMGVEPTGNGRRESYAHIPMPRMTHLRTTHRQFINFKTGLPYADWHALSVFTTNTNTAIEF